jgi:sulfate transport system permease protein
MVRILLRCIALGYLAAVLVAPLSMVFWNTFRGGLFTAASAVSSSAAVSALELTLIICTIVVFGNTIFGVWCALRLVRGGLPRPLSIFINTLVDMPFVVPDIVVGVALLTLYGRSSWLGGWLNAHGVSVVFSVPGMILATAFISLPFVVREVVPVLRHGGTEQQQAAATLGASSFQILWRVTLPSIRRAIGFGVVLTAARALGEYGAVSVVSGSVAGRTQTLTLLVDQRFQSFDLVGAHAAAMLLAILAMGTLVVMRRLSAQPVDSAP